MRIHHAARKVVGFSLMASVLALTLGCGGQNTSRLSGKVTFKGKAIPAGKIYFFPDTTKGNTGPGGYADIKDGEYDTAWTGGMGVVSGAMKVEIEAWEPGNNAKAEDTEVSNKALFPRYATAADLPKGDGTKDFDVPASAATAKPAGQNEHTGP